MSRKTHANPRGAKWGTLAKFPIIHAWETPKLSGIRLTPTYPSLERRREKDVRVPFAREHPFVGVQDGVGAMKIILISSTYENEQVKTSTSYNTKF